MNHQECYRLLGLSPTSDWADAHQAWRRAVQKWHPDRFTAEPERRHRAEARMQRLNAAHATLEAYYQKHGCLPLQASTATPTEVKPAEPPAATQPTSSGEAPTCRTQRFPRFALAIVGLLFVVFYPWLLPEDTSTHPSPPMPDPATPPQPHLTTAPALTHPGKPKAITSPAPLGSTRQVHPPGNDFFTYGDPLGKVIEIQGVPTRTVGDIWFYGASEVHFRDGRVVRWYASPDFPLKTGE